MPKKTYMRSGKGLIPKSTVKAAKRRVAAKHAARRKRNKGLF